MNLKCSQGREYPLLHTLVSFLRSSSSQLGFATPGVIHPPVASASPGSWLVMKNPKSLPKPTESGLGILTRSPQGSCEYSSQRSNALKYQIPSQLRAFVPVSAVQLKMSLNAELLWHSQDILFFPSDHICNYHKVINICLLH